MESDGKGELSKKVVVACHTSKFRSLLNELNDERLIHTAPAEYETFLRDRFLYPPRPTTSDAGKIDKAFPMKSGREVFNMDTRCRYFLVRTRIMHDKNYQKKMMVACIACNFDFKLMSKLNPMVDLTAKKGNRRAVTVADGDSDEDQDSESEDLEKDDHEEDEHDDINF